MADDRWWRDLDAVVAAVLAGGSRILDLGCGHGGLVDRLTELGFDSIGVDPRAPAYPRLVQAPIDTRRASANSTRSAPRWLCTTQTSPMCSKPSTLICAQTVDCSCPSSRGTRMTNVRSRGWRTTIYPTHRQFDRRLAWQREHDELHTWTTIREALSNCFAPTLEVGRPYLARMLRRGDLEADEHA